MFSTKEDIKRSLASRSNSYSKLFGLSKTSIQDRSLPCINLLDTISPTDSKGDFCNCPRKWEYGCKIHGKCSPTDPKEGVVNCGTCKQFTSNDPSKIEDIKVAVVIGAYGEAMVGMVELQLKSIRHLCGDEVLVMVSDDYSPERASKALRSHCDKYGATYILSNSESRIGHGRGDLMAFYNGLKFGFDNNCPITIKLSQRFLILQERWVQNTAEWMNKYKEPINTASDRCIEGSYSRGLRSESVVMRTNKWNDPVILRTLTTPSSGWYSAEIAIENCAKLAGDMIVWPLIGGPNRAIPAPEIVWHVSHSDESYQEVAKNYGIDLYQCGQFTSR